MRIRRRGLAGLLLATPARAQATLREQLIGTWIYVSSAARRDDGTALPRPELRGAVTYTAEGRFHFSTTRTDLPRYASNDSARPSFDEAMAVAAGVVAYAGSWRVDEAARTILLEIEMSSFPNLVGAPNQRRVVTEISAEEMRFTNPRTPAGITLDIAWRRAR